MTITSDKELETYFAGASRSPTDERKENSRDKMTE